MNGNQHQETDTLTFQPLTVMVAAWDHNRITPGSKHYLGVTLTNRGDQDAVVKVWLESPSELFPQWCSQPEQWLALTRNNSGELTFCIEVPGDTVPQWLDYDVVVRPQTAYVDCYLPPVPRRLQVLAPDITKTTRDPTFALTPETTPDRPLTVQPGTPVTVELTVENRSERVDRFRLECTGLPDDWGIQVDYPRDLGGLGLVQMGDSLGLNPGDRGIIRVFLQPPALPLAGSYLPTFRLSSANDPNLGLLGLVYLRVEPIYSLQTQLQPVEDQVRDRCARFNLQFANLGNTPRQVQCTLTPLTSSHQCSYRLGDGKGQASQSASQREAKDSRQRNFLSFGWQTDQESLPTDVITLAPQTTARIPLEAQPKPWWTRPWIGPDRVYSFRLDFTDPQQRSITPETLQGYLTWKPRPWWQLLLTLLAGLGLLGALAFLIWWYFLRPPTPPQLLEFAAEDSRYAAINNDMARVRWQIEHPEQIQTLKLTGYSSDGEILSGPLVYEFSKGQLPTALQPFCTQQGRLLQCNQVRSDAFQPGKYVFELTLIPKDKRVPPTSFKTSPVEITAKPLPIVTVLIPKSLVYREAAPGLSSPAEQALPVADAAGVRLDWDVTMPTEIKALHLIGRDQDGKMIGDRWYQFSSGEQLPEALRGFCQVGQTLVCRNFPTGLSGVGEYRLELQVVPVGSKAAATTLPGQAEDAGKAEAKPKSTEVIKILPQTPQILNFQINGREAPAKVLIPITQAQSVTVVQVGWRVQGGRTTRVELSPSPGHVPLAGRVNFPLSSQGTTTIALQVKTSTGEVLTRSVTIELFNPNPPDPVAQAIAAIKATTPKPSPSPGAPGAPPSSSASPPPKPFGVSSPAVPGRLSPSEQPPQFNGQ